MSVLDNLVPLRGRLGHTQYAGWTPKRVADSGLGCRVHADIGIPMEDGTRLSADVYTPKKSGRYPAIVQISAYNKELHAAGMPTGTNEVGSPPVLTDRGYVQVLASRRGMGRSEGKSGGFLDEQEISDYVRAIAWAAEQPWCNGDVVMFGTSYYGMVQPIVAARRPPALKALFANEICTDLFRQLVSFGGSVNNRFFGLWLGANFKEGDFARTVSPWQRAAASQLLSRDWVWSHVVHDRIDALYERFLHMRPTRDKRELLARIMTDAKTRETMPMVPGVFRELDRVEVPFVVVHNQADWNLHQFGAFDLFERAGTPEEDRYLILGEREYELPVLSWQLEALAFFDHVVKGCDNGYDEQPHVRYWVDGQRSFAGARSFPPPRAKETSLFLDAEGLSYEAPPQGSATFVAIPPSTPLPDGIDEVMDQELAFTLAPDDDLILAGPLRLHLRFSCNEIDSHVVASLSRVDSAGHRHLLTMGAMRPAQRKVDRELSTRFETVVDASAIEPLTPGAPVDLELSLVPATARIARGEKLLLQIAARTDRLRGKLRDGYVHFDLEVPPYFSKNTIHFGEGSRLVAHFERPTASRVVTSEAHGREMGYLPPS